ncbi:hypothetical protein GCM10009039_25370 [Halocalculus aciditolerans]|uniref:Uncharacterized protein n=2 Tax=Halocalculus aciditolerans TaxID=1383812 RepID=A0A830FL07_9EURY|nr:hypothetical protein GCM10009039_25370 [Halocalculus aciditolerans]
MADDLRADGWEVVTVRAGHVAPEPPGHGDTGRFGFVYLAQGDDAAGVERAVNSGTFDAYAVFSRQEGTSKFIVTRVTDRDRRLAVLLVGTVNLADASALAAAAHEREVMYSHVALLDGTHLAAFRHDDPADFLPEDA